MSVLVRRHRAPASAGVFRVAIISAAFLSWGRIAVAQDNDSRAALPPTQPPRLTLGEVYAEASRANPRAAAARSLASAVHARVPSAKRPPDPQLQLGFMNYELPGLAPMETLGMTQLQVMQ